MSMQCNIAARMIDPTRSTSKSPTTSENLLNEVGTETSSDADSDLFCLDWCDDPVATINSVTERNDKTRGGKELLAIVDSGAVDNTEYPLEATSKSQSELVSKERTGHTSSTMGSGAFESRQALEAI